MTFPFPPLIVTFTEMKIIMIIILKNIDEERKREIERRLVFYSFVVLHESLYNDADERAEVERERGKQKGKQC